MAADDQTDDAQPAAHGDASDDARRHPDGIDSSRRDFLKLGGIATAGLVVGGAVGAAAGAAIGHDARCAGRVRSTSAALPARSSPASTMSSSLMGENRSFDNLLGWLYTPDTLPDGRDVRRPRLRRLRQHRARRASASPRTSTAGATDDGDGHAPTRIRARSSRTSTPSSSAPSTPASNATSQVGDMAAPFNAPPAGTVPTMDGFVRDYWNNVERLRAGRRRRWRRLPHHGRLLAEQLPVLSTLAREFAVFDAWFAAVPSQTYCNRSFFHASTSHGFVTNKHGGGYDKWLDAPRRPRSSTASKRPGSRGRCTSTSCSSSR